jgi:hypothetical protein
MNVKVLKSPSTGRAVMSNNHYLNHPAHRATVRYTPNARCVLHIRITDNDNNELNKILMDHTSVLPALCTKVCASLPIKQLQRDYQY